MTALPKGWRSPKIEMPDIKTQTVETDEVCEKCGSKMVIKWGKFGRFMACSGYPECRNTREIPKSGRGRGTKRIAAGRDSVRKVRQTDGFEAGPLRRVYGLFRIS